MRKKMNFLRTKLTREELKLMKGVAGGTDLDGNLNPTGGSCGQEPEDHYLPQYCAWLICMGRLPIGPISILCP